MSVADNVGVAELNAAHARMLAARLGVAASTLQRYYARNYWPDNIVAKAAHLRIATRLWPRGMDSLEAQCEPITGRTFWRVRDAHQKQSGAP